MCHFFSRFCCSACLKTGMDTYHPVEARSNVQKLFWSKKEVSQCPISVRGHSLKIYDLDIQERYEETSGNILLTLRSITQKPLQYFLDSKDFAKVMRETSNILQHILLLRLTKLLASSSLQRRRNSIIQITRTSPTLKDTGRARLKDTSA